MPINTLKSFFMNYEGICKQKHEYRISLPS
nr:MAG TPA: hypothetical protein [Caudoviricetes sp.]